MNTASRVAFRFVTVTCRDKQPIHPKVPVALIGDGNFQRTKDGGVNGLARQNRERPLGYGRSSGCGIVPCSVCNASGERGRARWHVYHGTITSCIKANYLGGKKVIDEKMRPSSAGRLYPADGLRPKKIVLDLPTPGAEYHVEVRKSPQAGDLICTEKAQVSILEPGVSAECQSAVKSLAQFDAPTPEDQLQLG